MGKKMIKIHDDIQRNTNRNHGPKGDNLEVGVRATAEQIMDPNAVAFLPCGTAPRVTGTHYRREIVVSPSDPTQQFSGVIKLRPQLENFLSIDTDNGDPIDLSAASLRGREFEGEIPYVEIFEDNFYFPAFYVETSSGVVKGSSRLEKVDRLDCWGQSPVDGEWHRGYISVVNAKCTLSTNCNYSNLIFGDGSSTVHQCTIYVGQVDETGAFVFGASAVATTSSGSFPDLTGVPGVALGYAIQATNSPSPVYYKVRARIDALDITDYDPVDYFLEPQVETDEVYQTLKNNNTGSRMSAADLLVAFRGSDMNNAGIIGVARVPEGTVIPEGSAKSVYDWIAALPYDNYTGPVKDGGHTFWMPKTLKDIMFRKKTDPRQDSNMLVIAFVIPGSSAGQITQFSIVAKSTWEWIYASQSLPQFIGPPGYLFLEALYAVLGRYNPSGCNPDHKSKIRQIAGAIAKNPAVKQLAKQALQLLVTGTKEVLPMLIGGVAL